jgi:hypothetical protein
MSEPVIQQALALDAQGNVIGVYAVDKNIRDLPGIDHAELIDMPDAPVGTGRFIEVPDDLQDPQGPTHQEEVLEWPTAGWQWNPNIPKFVTPGGGNSNNPNN